MTPTEQKNAALASAEATKTAIQAIVLPDTTALQAQLTAVQQELAQTKVLLEGQNTRVGELEQDLTAASGKLTSLRALLVSAINTVDA